MSAIREAIFAQIMLLLDIGDAAELERMPRGDPMQFPALHIFDGGDTVIEDEPGSTRRQLSVTIEGYVAGAGGAAAHTELNALHAHVCDCMTVEPPLAGLAAVEIVDTGSVRIDIAELANSARLAFAQDFSITYSVVRGGMSHQV